MYTLEEIREFIESNHAKPYLNLKKTKLASGRHETWFMVTAISNLKIVDLLNEVNNKLDIFLKKDKEEIKDKEGDRKKRSK